jgi:hypothetical protein
MARPIYACRPWPAAQPAGRASGTVVVSGAAAGRLLRAAAAAGGFGLDGTAFAALRRYAAAGGSLAFTGAVMGGLLRYAVASGNVALSGQVAGLIRKFGAAPGTLSLSGSAAGTVDAPIPTTGLVGRYETAGITPQTAGAFTGWTDSSGLGNHVTSVVGSTINTEIRRGIPTVTFANNSYFELPSSMNFSSQSMSAYFVVRAPALTGSYGFFTAGTSAGSGALAQMNITTSNIRLTMSGTNKDVSFSRGQNLFLAGFRAGTNNGGSNGVKAFANGQKNTFAEGTLVTQTMARVGMGIVGASYYTGHLVAFWIYNTPLSDADVAQLRAYALLHYHTGADDLSDMLVIEGDSLSASYGLSDTYQGWQYYYELISSPKGKKHRHFAVAGQWINHPSNTDMLTTASTDEVDLALSNNSAFASRTAVMAGGHNDLANGRSAADVWADVITWANGRLAAGATRIAVFTVAPSAAISGANETQRVAYRSLVLGNITTAFTSANAIAIDVAGDSRFSNTGNTTYFQTDGTHWEAPGGTMAVAEIAVAAGL